MFAFSQQDISLEAGYALSLFAYNNTTQQAAILQNGGIPIAMYEPFLNSRNEMERAKAAFQVAMKQIIKILKNHLTATVILSH